MGLAWMSLVLAALAGLPGSLPLPSTPPLPGWLQGAMGGPAVGEARRQPPAIIGSSIPGPLAGDWIQDPPGPWRILDEGRLLHHLRPSPPRPPGRRLIGNGGLYQKQSRHRHINRVKVGVVVEVGVEVGEVDGEGGSRKKFISPSYRDPLLVLHLFISNDS